MSVVEVKVGSRFFNVACEDGQEKHLTRLASDIDSKIASLARQLRTNNEPLLLLMTALMMQDELNEFAVNKTNDNNLEQKLKELTDKKETEMAEILKNIAGFVESVTDKIDK